MAFEQILSVSGKSGLFRLVGQMKNGIIVESIEDGKRFPVHGSAKVSALEEISIYTDTEEVPLKEVFTIIYEKENGKKAVDPKDGDDTVKTYFESILPKYDRERVYVSDMHKVVRWYNQLIEHKAFDPNEGKEEESNADDATDKKSDKKDAKKATKKTAATKKSGAAASKAAAKASSKSKAGGASIKSTGSQRGS
ncbi:MAG: DUF5606 domain-containing protein [Salibacteraceae bacterium]